MSKVAISIMLDSDVLERFGRVTSRLGIDADSYFQRCAEELVTQGRSPFASGCEEVDFDMNEDEACDFAAAHAKEMVDHAW